MLRDNQPSTSAQAYRQPSIDGVPSSRTKFEFEVAEYEDADTEMAGHYR
jgi:hypothetical protein